MRLKIKRDSVTYEREMDNKTSKYKGVCIKQPTKYYNKFEARVCIHTKVYSLGIFFTENAAAVAYDMFIKTYYPDKPLNETSFPELLSWPLTLTEQTYINKRIEKLKKIINKETTKLRVEGVKKVKEKRVLLEEKLPKEELQKLIYISSIKEIARKYNCASSSIVRLLKLYQIERPSILEKIIYINDLNAGILAGYVFSCDLKTVAQMLNTTTSNVRKLIKHYNIYAYSKSIIKLID